MASTTPTSGKSSSSGKTKSKSKREDKKDKHKEKRKKKKKQITRSTILGSLPPWILWIVMSGIAVVISLNTYLAFSLMNDNRNNAMPFLRQMWDKSKGRLKELSVKSRGYLHNQLIPQHDDNPNCESFGCAITPPNYKGEEIQQALAKIHNETGDSDDSIAPFASWDMATMTRMSNRKHPPFNQDRAVIIKPYQTTQTTASEDFLVGIFDGHGEDGHYTAQYFVQDVPKRLAQKLNSIPSSSSSSLSNTTQSAIVQMLKESFVESDQLAPTNITHRGGCTASVTLRVGNHLYFANAGDSRTMLVAVNERDFEIVEAGPAPGVAILYVTRADKPHLPDELARIQAANGTVHIPPQNPNLSRVIVHSDVFNDTIGLAMSRSLGDYEWTVKGVTPEPIVDVIYLENFFNITEDTRDPMLSVFLVAASDGLWDYRLKQWYAKQFAESFLNDNNDKRKKHPFQKMQDVIEFVSPQKESFYRDDITAITVRIL